MGIYDEQIKSRIMQDEEALSDAFSEMARVVVDKKFSIDFEDDRIKLKTTIDRILKYYHIKRKDLPENVVSISDQLDYLMRPAGIMWRKVKLEAGWHKDSVGVLLGTLRSNGNPVALIPRRTSGYVMYEGEKPKMKVKGNILKLIDDEAICFYKPLPQKSLSTFSVFKFIIGNTLGSEYIRVVLAAYIALQIGLMLPWINEMIYSNVIVSGSFTVLLSTFTFLICVNISQLIMQTFQGLVVQRIIDRVNVVFQAAIMSRLVALPTSFFKRYSAGDLANRIDRMGELCPALIKPVLTVGLTAIFSLAYITQMFKYGPDLVVPAMVIMALTVFFALVEIVSQMQRQSKILESESNEAGLIYELFSGVQKIRLSGAENRAFSKWANIYTPTAKLKYRMPRIFHLSKVASQSMAVVGMLVIYFYTIRTGVSLADYFAFQAAFAVVVGAFTSLVEMAKDLASIKPLLDMVKPILKEVPEITEDKKPVTNISGGIEMNSVTFRYGDGLPTIVDDLNLKIRNGEYVAIVGKTGCGKSTLMRLLLGFEKPQRGAVYYGNINLNNCDKRTLRQKIGVVTQEGKLFQGDIFSNIAIGNPWMSEDAVWAAAEIAGIAEDIRQMPMGMHTQVSSSGGLSGGQKQRLMIARAIASKPKILMLDEATSALDNITQKRISESLDKLKCTRIVIAHRLSTIKNCHRILVMDKGKIVEDGSYGELVERGGIFAELVKRQINDNELS